MCAHVCQKINLCFAGGRDPQCMRLYARHVLVLFVSNEHPPVRLQESLSFCTLNGSRRLAFMSESDQLSDFQLVVCGFGWISVLLYTRLFDVVHCLSSCIPLISSHSSTGKAEGNVCSKLLIQLLLSLLWLAICSPLCPFWSRQHCGDETLPKRN